MALSLITWAGVDRDDAAEAQLTGMGMAVAVTNGGSWEGAFASTSKSLSRGRLLENKPMIS